MRRTNPQVTVNGEQTSFGNKRQSKNSLAPAQRIIFVIHLVLFSILWPICLLLLLLQMALCPQTAATPS